MRINADFGEPVMLDTARMDWIASPMPGVERKMLDRIGGEVARATSLVRYAPGSHFSAHSHDGGEEFLVLGGIFSDEHGDYPAGTYVRNPIGTRHSPHSEPGCVILVKLHQFDPDDHAQFSVDWTTSEYGKDAEPGIATLPLHQHGGEDVRIERWDTGAERHLPGIENGLEIFVIEGSLTVNSASMAAGGWLRMPAGASIQASTASGCRIYIKQGHLRPRLHLDAACTLAWQVP
jgi:quercetin dioxygenase-like cupin family protein